MLPKEEPIFVGEALNRDPVVVSFLAGVEMLGGASSSDVCRIKHNTRN